MKPVRNSSWELDWRENERIRKEAEKAVGYEPISWSDRQSLKQTMTEEQFEAWDKAVREKEHAVREIWNAETLALAEGGQTLLNMRNNELDAFCSVFQRADRILTGMANLSFGVTEERNGTPAWSDGKSITLNVAEVKQISPETLSSLHGLNYHELSHLLYTPRVGSDLGAWVKEKSTIANTNVFNEDTMSWDSSSTGDVRYQLVFNLLEDFRAENYLITKYPSVKDFLVSVVLDYAIDLNETTNLFDHAYLIMAGRPFLPANVLAISAHVYKQVHGQDKTELLYRVANEYRTLVFPRDYARAKELIEKLVPIIPSNLRLPNGCQDRPVLRNGRPEGAKGQEALSEAQEAGMDWSEMSAKFDEMMSKEAEAQEAGETGDQTGYGKEAGNNEAGLGDKFADPIREHLANALERAVEQAIDNPAVAKKVSETLRAINKQNSTKSFLGRQARSLMSPKPNDVMAVRMFAQELERIRIECDPDWQREVPTGKLNVRRAIQADVNDINKLFDRWNTGNDDYDIEACILLDRSGSMYSQMDSASKATWVIKRAIEKINGKVSVMTFNDQSRLLYSADEPATTEYPSVLSAGGTDPMYALVEADRILTNSKSKTKLLFIVTDGQFYGGKSDEIIKSLKSQGVNTNLVFMSESEGWAKWATEHASEIAHGVDNFRVINKPMELVKVAKDVVRHQIKSTIR